MHRCRFALDELTVRSEQTGPAKELSVMNAIAKPKEPPWRLNGSAVQAADKTCCLMKRLERELEHLETRKLLPEIHELQRCLNTLETDLFEDGETSIGEAC
jgi:hypothetical protein